MKVTVVGSGYVGLVTGVCLADVGNDVCCFDVDQRKIDMLRRGEIPIYEPGLDELVRRNVAAGRLRFTTDVAESVAHGAIQFIAVGTPPDEDGSADLSYVLAAARAIATHMTEYTIVVDKSTVPVGTADKVQAAMAEVLAQRKSEVPFAVVSNPEFLKEGAAIDDFMKPDRIVLGVADPKAAEIMRELYAPFQRNHERTIVMSIRSAELTKYAANSMLATRISFMNEIALLADLVGADVEEVRKGIGSDPRIGYHFLYAGTGYGGSCFPKDVKALIRTSAEYGLTMKVLTAVEEVNDRQKTILLDKAKAKFGSLKGKRFGLWGLAFKPDTDDMREAPARALMEALWAEGATVVAYDPVAMHETKRIYGERTELQLAFSAVDAVKDVDALFIATEWKEFRSPDFAKMKELMKAPVIFDGRNLYDPAAVRRQGMEYVPIGRR